MEVNKNIWLLKVVHVENRAIEMEITDTAELVFSSKEMAKQWLLHHGFVYGFHPEFKNPGEPYWFHAKDQVWDHINVNLTEKQVDNEITPDWLVMR